MSENLVLSIAIFPLLAQGKRSPFFLFARSIRNQKYSSLKGKFQYNSGVPNFGVSAVARFATWLRESVVNPFAEADHVWHETQQGKAPVRDCNPG